MPYRGLPLERRGPSVPQNPAHLAYTERAWTRAYEATHLASIARLTPFKWKADEGQTARASAMQPGLADGSYYRDHARLTTGSKDFAVGLRDALSVAGFNSTIATTPATKGRKNPYYSVRVSSAGSSLRNFYNFLYTDAKLFIPRKRTALANAFSESGMSTNGRKTMAPQTSVESRLASKELAKMDKDSEKSANAHETIAAETTVEAGRASSTMVKTDADADLSSKAHETIETEPAVEVRLDNPERAKTDNHKELRFQREASSEWKPGLGGHAPSEIRNLFLLCIERNLRQVENEGKTVSFWTLVRQLWNCTDYVPNEYCDVIKIPHWSTFARAARIVNDWPS